MVLNAKKDRQTSMRRQIDIRYRNMAAPQIEHCILTKQRK